MKLYEERACPYPDKYAATLEPVELWLAERCVIVNDGTWLVRRPDGVWEGLRSKKAATHKMTQFYKGGDPKLRVSVQDIETFLNKTAPCVRGGMKVPTSKSPVVEAFGFTYVNTWVNRLMPPNPNALADPIMRARLTMILRMIRECLCAASEPKTLDEMIGIINGNDPNEVAFRFTIHWLAAPLQQVGVNLQTNLWHVGEQNGMGKGTLSLIMSMIYGWENVKSLNEDELSKGGWTDKLIGGLFIIWNEIKQSRDFDANSFIKQNSTEDTIPIRKRNVDCGDVINFGNWYITGNRETSPWGALDLFDRRNAIIATSDDASKLPIAKEVREWIVAKPDEAQQVVGGFVYLLQNIKINNDLIARAPDTALKTEMQEGSSPEQDGLFWLINDSQYPRDRWLPAKEYLNAYKAFNDISNLSPKRFSGSIMGKLARKGHIEVQQKYKTSPKEFRISSEKFPVWTSDMGESKGATGFLTLVPKAKR